MSVNKYEIRQDNFTEKDIFTSFSKSFKNMTKFINQRIKFVPTDSYLYDKITSDAFFPPPPLPPIPRNLVPLLGLHYLHADNINNTTDAFNDTDENYLKLNYKLYKFIDSVNVTRAPPIIPRIHGAPVLPDDIDFIRLYSCYKLQYILNLERHHEYLYNLTDGVNNTKIIREPTDIVDLFNYYGISGNNYSLLGNVDPIVIELTVEARDPSFPPPPPPLVPPPPPFVYPRILFNNPIRYIINELDYCFQIYLNFIDNIYTHILYTLKISSKQRNIGLSAIKKIRDILKYTTIFPPKPLDQKQIYHQTKLQDIIAEILPKKLNSLNLRPYIQKIFIKINDTIINL